MKILQLLDSLSWSGGVETYVLSLLPRLTQAGHCPIVAHARGDTKLDCPTFRIENLGAGEISLERAVYQQVSDLITAERPDVVHVHNIYNLGAVQACLDNAPTIATTHGFQWMCPAQDLYLERTAEICESSCSPACFSTSLVKKCMSLRPRHAWRSYRRSRFGIRNAHRFQSVIAPSTDTGNRYIRAGFNRQQVRVLPYFCPVVPLTVPRPIPANNSITFLGRVRPYKGCRYFVEALGRLPNSVSGTIVGDAAASAQAELKAIAEATGCSDRLHFQSWVDRARISELFEKTSVFVFPSIWPETLGIVGLEAMAHGVPVVACDVGGVREWLIDGETGWLTPPKNSEAIATAVARLLNDPGQAKLIGENGIRYMQERFSIERHVAQLLEIYEGAKQ